MKDKYKKIGIYRGRTVMMSVYNPPEKECQDDGLVDELLVATNKLIKEMKKENSR